VLKIKLVCFAPHAEVGKRQVDQANEVHHGKDNGAGRRVLPDKLVQQQTGGADDNEDEGGYFEEVSHLNVDYSMIWRVVQSKTYNISLVD